MQRWGKMKMICVVGGIPTLPAGVGLGKEESCLTAMQHEQNEQDLRGHVTDGRESLTQRE